MAAIDSILKFSIPGKGDELLHHQLLMTEGTKLIVRAAGEEKKMIVETCFRAFMTFPWHMRQVVPVDTR